MPSARHSKETPRWGTPADIVERSRKVMGGIDLDPCSSDYFQATVQAGKYYSLDDRGEDGLVLPWGGKVFVNPPSGAVKQFWRRATSQPVEQLIWVGYSVEQLALLASENHHPMDFSFCILRKRLHFKRHDGYMGSPSHANYACGINVDHAKFARYFGELGRVYPK